ncbi:MAG: TIGR03905 family TSCPD domain-containing protein [Ruminococcus sp.]|nr:TIGR03905 family TSCPD domain-containing protein [Ruminococcus sp.]
MQYTYIPKGVCSRQIVIDAADGIINDIRFIGGCSGNTQGIGALVKGMAIDDVIMRLEHIRCGNRPTSCPDQLAQALKLVKQQ